MADLTFEISAKWAGTGRTGEGRLTTGGKEITYSAPASMGGKGVGTSPEELLMSAVTACYSGTLFYGLQKAGLPVSTVDIRTQGVVEDYPGKARFARLVVHPTIAGGDPARKPEYEALAVEARDRCFIGKTVRASVQYEVGTVSVEG